MASSEPRRAGVVGSPVAHSLSPVLHEAAYRARGRTGWTFDRLEADADALPALVAGLGPEWIGLAVTMPGKRAALAIANERTPRADAVGAANTLLRLPDGWRADCTDITGITGALRAAGGYLPRANTTAVVLGAGGTAAAALVALRELLVGKAIVVVRDPSRAADVRATAARIGLSLDIRTLAAVDLRTLAGTADIVISTVPAGVADAHAADLAEAPCVLDVVYHPWPTPLATAVTQRGGRLATGLDMLLHQAFEQVEQFTGEPAPRVPMRDALRAATGNVLPLPLVSEVG